MAASESNVVVDVRSSSVDEERLMTRLPFTGAAPNTTGYRAIDVRSVPLCRRDGSELRIRLKKENARRKHRDRRRVDGAHRIHLADGATSRLRAGAELPRRVAEALRAQVRLPRCSEDAAWRVPRRQQRARGGVERIATGVP